jgi:oligopeptide transport system substrate-binding protein
MIIQKPRVRWLPTLASALALFGILLGGCASNAGVVQRDPNQVFVYPNTAIQHALPLWGKDGGAAGTGPAESGLELDPAFLVDLYSQAVDSMIQVQLVTIDQNRNIVPDAAQSWNVSDNGLTWTFHLRPNLLWADGTPLTSYDFALGMQHDLDPNLCNTAGPMNPPDPTALKRNACTGGQNQLSYLGYIKGAQAFASATPNPTTGKPPTTISGIVTTDPQTIQFHLTQPIAFFLQQLTTVASMPIETSVFKQYGFRYVEHFADPTAPSQSGPWIIKRWFDPNNPSVTDPQHATEIQFVPNPHWWGKPLILKEVDMPLISNSNDFYNRYLEGGANKIDYALVPAADYPFAQNLPDFHAVPQLAIEYFGMNFLDPPFDNLQVRQAFDLALNKQVLVDTVFQGAYSPTNHIIPYGIPGNNPDLLTPPANGGTVSLTGNQDEAKQLLQQVALACESDYNHDWCPYIIGSAGANRQPVSSVASGGANCPAFKVGVTSGGATTQKPIVVYAPSDNDNRVRIARAAAQQWVGTLCLNISTSNDPPNTPVTFRSIIGDLYTAEGTRTASKESIWTIAYSVDYVDPQDYTTNQFSLSTSNNFGEFGVKNPNANDDQSSIEAAMAAADQMPATTAADQQARIRAYQQIEQELVDDVAWIPYDQPQILYRVRSYVENFVMPASEFLSDQDWSNIFIAAHT